MDREELKREIANVQWYHCIELGNGIVTPGRCRNFETLKTLGLPADLTGLKVLDIGAWDGFYSFEAEKRGALSVLATDYIAWGGPAESGKKGFDLARRALGSHVNDMVVDIPDLTPERVGVFDIVLFLGVFYHLIHPMIAMERIFNITGKQLIMETQVDLLGVKWPALRFYPGDELGKDASNWFGPNVAAVLAMLKVAGFSRIEVVRSPRSFSYRLVRSAFLKFKHGRGFLENLQQDRLVIHAWR